MLKVNHTFANCYLKGHPDANKDSKTPWKDSKNGKAYAAHKQSSPILPWHRVLIAGTEWKGLKGTSNEYESDKCFFFENYLSSLSSKLDSSSSFLHVIITAVVLQFKESKDVPKTSAKALLDTGSLAGDFISNDLVISMNLVRYIEENTNKQQICSGLDNSCSSALGSIVLSLSLWSYRMYAYVPGLDSMHRAVHFIS